MINILDANWEFETLTVNNFTVTGNLTMQNGDGNDTIQTNMITNVDNTTSIDMDVGDTNTAINLTAFAVNTYGVASFSSNVNLNNANAIIGGYGNVALVSTNDLRATTNSGYSVFLNNDKTSGNCIINSGSPASNVVISNGNLLMNTIQLNPLQYVIINGQPNTYYWSQIQKSYSTIFVAQTSYGGNVGLVLDSPVTDGIELTVVSQMPVTYALTIYNETGFDFYGNIAGGNNLIVLQNNDYVVLKAIAGLWYVITIKT